MEKQAGISVIDLEEQLINDREGTHSERLKQELFELAAGVKIHIDSGLAPDEFARFSKLKDAAEAGIAVLDKVRQGLSA